MPNMEISTVVGCKMNCGYCPQKLHIKKYNEVKRDTVMSMDTFRICLAQIPTHVEILFAGMAEPWLNPWATEMLLMASQTHRVGVYTTCYGMKLHDVEAIKDLDFLHFCIHVPDQDGVMNLKITREYLEVLAQAIKIPSHNITCIGKVNPYVKAVIGKEVPDSSNTLISRAGSLKAFAIPKKKGELFCSATGPKIDHNVLLPNGDVVLCCMIYGLDHIIGNLLVDSYEDLFESNEYKRIMEGLKDDNSSILCRKCEISAYVR